MAAGLIIHVVVVITLLVIGTFRYRGQGRFKFVGNPQMTVLVLYCLSAVTSLFVRQPHIPAIDMSLTSNGVLLVYSSLILISLLPALQLRGVRLTPNVIGRSPGVLPCLWIAAFLGWFAVLYQIPYAFRAFELGASEVRFALNVRKEALLPTSWFTTVAVGISSFYLVFMVLFFISAIRGYSRTLTMSLFVGSISYVVSSYAFGARDGAVFYVMGLAFIIPIFWAELSRSFRRKLVFGGGAIAMLLAVGLAVTTLDRFGENGRSGLFAGTAGYIGQQPYVFAETVQAQSYFYGTSLRFPIINEVFGGDAEIVRSEAFEWSFGTFLKDYYSMYGWDSLVGMTLFGSTLFIALFSLRRRLPPSSVLLIYLLYFQLMTSGVFYFRLGTRGGNLYLILFGVLLVASLALKRKKNHVVRI